MAFDKGTDSTKQVIAEVSKIVSDIAGIQLGDRQSVMVESRLRSRMGRLKIDTFQEYLAHLKSNTLDESQALVSLLTTHHTYFFREFSHFEFLLNSALKDLVQMARARADKTIRVWSAACSTGQEVYSLAMFFNFHLKAMAPEVKIEIVGTDVDPKSVETARNGVYRVEELKTAPAMYMEGQWIRGTGEVAEFYKASKRLRGICKFEVANLQNLSSFVQNNKFDLIFCRNVFIYFNEQQIKTITASLLNALQPDGWLVLGVSETLMGLDLDVGLVGPSVYRRNKAKPLATPPPAAEKTYRVLCVDDSPTIHALLGKILIKEKNFEIGAKAKNGREALEILKTQKFDAITLDLHMPEVDGVSFLQQYQDRSAPILILSSVNRDEMSLGQRALQLGAFDYVEKPSLDKIAQAGEEIRAKLKTGIRMKGASIAPSTPVKSAPAAVAVKKKIRVLIVDDSVTIRNLLTKILQQDPAFEIAGQTESPLQVEKLLETLKPDLMTLDIHMPDMDGVTLLKRLNRRKLVPTVMISSISKEEGPYVLEALENGAIDYIQKPSMSELVEMGPIIRERLKTAASVNLKSKQVAQKVSSTTFKMDPSSLIVIGSSTGGTEALRIVLESLPKEIPPILVTQHIPPVFSKAFADRLNQICPFEVLEGEDGMIVQPGRVIIAPGGCQMAVSGKPGALQIRVTDDPPMNRHRPSVDFLFRSVARVNHSRVIAVMLTGMGADGANEMKSLRDLGARTIAQDEATCVVFGMPRAAIERGGAEFVSPLEQIGFQIAQLSASRSKAA